MPAAACLLLLPACPLLLLPACPLLLPALLLQPACCCCLRCWLLAASLPSYRRLSVGQRRAVPGLPLSAAALLRVACLRPRRAENDCQLVGGAHRDPMDGA